MGGFLEYLSLNWDHVVELAIGHAIVVAISLALDIVIGVSLGVLVFRRERAANVALAITSMFLTIPSFALFGLFIPIFGLGYPPTVVDGDEEAEERERGDEIGRASCRERV